MLFSGTFCGKKVDVVFCGEGVVNAQPLPQLVKRAFVSIRFLKSFKIPIYDRFDRCSHVVTNKPSVLKIGDDMKRHPSHQEAFF